MVDGARDTDGTNTAMGVHIAVGIARSSWLRPSIVCDGSGHVHSRIAAELSIVAVSEDASRVKPRTHLA